jgi:hypothetical protein
MTDGRPRWADFKRLDAAFADGGSERRWATTSRCHPPV